MPNDAYLSQIAQQWKERGPELADWIMQTLVNRTDVWGRYLPKKNRKAKGESQSGFQGHAITAPFRDERGKVFLGATSLIKHFKAVDGGVLGVHSVARDGSSRWFAIDIDRHDDDDHSVTAEGNFMAALGWYTQLQELGFDPLFLDSNGNGGFHIWVILEQPVRCNSLRAFVERFVGDYAKRGLDQCPDLFPGTHGSNHLGSWLRLPGRHHTREHFTRVYNDQSWDDQRWLEGHDAIDRILATQSAPAAMIQKLGMTESIKTVCLDFDGVIHSYRSGWRGAESIPDPPIHGVRDSIQQLRKQYRVVIHSARGNTAEGRAAIARWLAKHDIEVDEVCEHKPPALVYVDDRAIAFQGDWAQTMLDIKNFRK